MTEYNINNSDFKSSEIYKKFMNDNPGYGYLKIRAYSANEAIPISDLRIVIKKSVDDNTIIFFEGITDSSGIIEKIKLPTPKINLDNMEKPNKIQYQIAATKNNFKRNYLINMYEGVCVVQNINVNPNMENL